MIEVAPTIHPQYCEHNRHVLCNIIPYSLLSCCDAMHNLLKYLPEQHGHQQKCDHYQQAVLPFFLLDQELHFFF